MSPQFETQLLSMIDGAMVRVVNTEDFLIVPTGKICIYFYDYIRVSNKKPHLADFETCVFRGYLRNHLSYKKVFNVYLHPFLKSFLMEK